MYKCKLCGKKYKDLTSLYNHIETKHADMIPQDMSVQQYYYYMKTGKMNGNCVMCKQPTSWNKNTNKYNRFCGDEKCKEKYVQIMKSRMIAKYGKAHLLNDPNKQREMLANRSISGTYEWSDGKHTSTYTGSYELDFLKTLDNFFEWDPEDISMPSPHTYTYEYEGERKFYIPDVFIHSLDLELEIKDGGDNPNRHHKIQDVDKVKEKLKDDVLTSQKNFHYVKITNKNYSNFFDFLKEVKAGFEKYGDDKKIPRIFKTEDILTHSKPIIEAFDNFDIAEEGAVDAVFNIGKKSFRESDLIFSLKFDLVKGSPKELQDFLTDLIKGAKTRDDLLYVHELSRRPDTFYHNLVKKCPELSKACKEYQDWTYTGMRKEMKTRLKKIGESYDEIDFDLLEEKFEPDKMLIWLDKPKEKLLNKNIRLYHAAPKYNDRKEDTFEVGQIVQPKMLTTGATKLSNPRLAMYFWDNKEFAMHWGVFCELRDELRGKVEMYYSANTSVKSLMHVSSSMQIEEVIDIIVNSNYAFYIYETEVKIDKLEMGSLNLIKEYTLSEPFKILKKTKVEITRDILLKYIDISNNVDESNKIIKKIDSSRKSVRGLATRFMDDRRDDYRLKVQKDIIQNHGGVVTDELYNDYRKRINKSIKANSLELLETPEIFDLLEEKFDPDKFLVWFDKPVSKLLNKKIRLYHATEDEYWDTGDIVQPKTINPGATKMSLPRFALYFWDNIEFGHQWGIYRALRHKLNEICEARYTCTPEVKLLVTPRENITKEELIDKILKSKISYYIYEVEVDASKLEMGPVNYIKEYTVSEPVKILKKHEFKITKDILMKWVFIAISDNEKELYMKELAKHQRNVRGIAALFMNSHKDEYRVHVLKDLDNKISNNEIDENNIDEKTMKDYRRRINKSIRAGATDRLLETPEAFDLLEEKFEPDKFLVWFDKPVKKLVGGKLRIYHGSSVNMVDEYIDPISLNVGATKYSTPRWSTYFWDNREDAMKWASVWEVSNYHRETLYIGHNGKSLLGKPDGVDSKTFVKELINKMSKAKFYIYECEVDIKDLEIGSCPSIKEYTVSKPVKILKKFEYTLNKEIVRRCFNILPVDEVIKFKEENKGVKHLKLHRNFILNNVLDNTRDTYRSIIRTDLQQGNINVGDDLSGYKDSINYHVKRDTHGLRESYITDIMEESSISMVQLNLYLQNQYEEEMKHYLDTYKQYYEIMRKEKPHAIKNLNEDIKRAIIFIDGLASKGVENNLVQFAREELGNIVNIPKRGNAVKIHESTDVLNLKLVYENSNTRSLFGLADTKTQLVVNDEFIIKRDKMGNHCSVSLLENVMNTDNIIEFEIKFNDSLDFDKYLKENMNDGISLNTMFNFRDEEYKFIKEACLKLFGNYPESINKK